MSFKLIKRKAFFFMFIVHNLTLYSDQISYSESKQLGYLIGKKVQSNEFRFNINEFLEGINAKEDLEIIHEKEYLNLINFLQDLILLEKKAVNLKIADTFLSNNKSNPNVTEIIPGKIQYKIINNGTGKEVSEDTTPLVKYKVTTLDNKILYKTEEAQVVSLIDIIPGLTKGILGMKEGEARVVYIHPDYSSKEFLLKFEIELIKRHCKSDINKFLISKQEYVR